MIKRSEILKSLNETCEGNVISNYLFGEYLQGWSIQCKEIDWNHIREWGNVIVRITTEERDSIRVTLDRSEIEWD